MQVYITLTIGQMAARQQFKAFKKANIFKRLRPGLKNILAAIHQASEAKWDTDGALTGDPFSEMI